MLIETNTNYSFWIRKNHEKIGFEDLIEKAKTFTSDFDKNSNQELRDMLLRGVEIISTEFQMQKYFELFGEIHRNKLLFCFENLANDILSQDQIEIIDYGCGQGLGCLVFLEFLKKNKLKQKIKKITLIDPSKISIERAALHVNVFFPESEIVTINKLVGELKDFDLVKIEENSLHIFSNILDIDSVDLFQLSDFIKKKIGGNSHFVCVSPRNENFTKRINYFKSLLDGDCYFSKDFWKNEWDGNCTISVRLIRKKKNQIEIIEKEIFEIVKEELLTNMVLVKGGSFFMGATDEQNRDFWENELPVQHIKISEFKISKYQITQRLWYAVMGDNPSFFIDAKAPVESISWDECLVFIRKINNMTGLTFSLPTEAQWEYAARGGIKSNHYKYSGSNNLDEIAWNSENSGFGTKAVGLKKSNELDLFDLNGNVWEWCLDWFAIYEDKKTITENPICCTITNFKVIRGGAWNSGKEFCRISTRQSMSPSFKQNFVGFRLVQVF